MNATNHYGTFLVMIACLLIIIPLSGNKIKYQNNSQALVAVASEFKMPSLKTNEQFIESIRGQNFDLENVDAVFSYVFGELKDNVYIYPTENYYYFQFYTNGGDIWGNLRLDSIDREDGVISFAYFRVANRREPYFTFQKTWHKLFGADDGVILYKINPLTYTITYGKKTVTFHLHDVPQTIPEDLALHPSEVFVSRTFDESGFQFILLYDKDEPSFRFVLDESVPLPDILQPYGKDIFVGRRSGFAFYAEPGMDRMVLFGVDKKNIQQNNYYDGPFDQLADNFVDEKRFEQQVVSAYPHLKGKVRGRGDFLDKAGKRTGTRIRIAPHVDYSAMVELWEHFSSCQQTSSIPMALIRCITKQ